MIDQNLRKKILELNQDRSGIPKDIIYETFKVTQFDIFNGDLFEIFNERFKKYWIDISKYFEHKKDLWGKETEVEIYEAVFRDTLFDQFKYLYYGKLFENARENLKDDDLEQSISFDEHTGFFRTTRKRKAIEDIAEHVFFMAITMIELVEGKVDFIKKKLEDAEDRYGLYPKKLFEIAYRIQNENIGKRPRITDEDAIIFANREGKFYDEKLLENENGRTSFLLNITKSYSNHHKPKLKKANQ